MNATELQQQLFNTIKSKIPDHLSAPEEMAKLLDVSVDSVYRRMRGEKVITLDELQTLCTHYKISLDQMMNIQTGSFLFQGNLLNSETFRYEAYQTGMMHTLAYFNSFKEKEYYYLCKDIPLFYYSHSRDLAAFKYFFWMRTLVHFPDFKNTKVNFDEFPDSIFELGKKSLALYNQIDCNEVWTMESFNTTIRQVEYYVDSKVFNSNKDALRVYEALEKFLDHIEHQAALGYKYNYNDPEKKPLGKLNLYLNEFILLDNTMVIKMDNTKMAVIPHCAIDYITTRDISFVENLYKYAQNLMRRSTLISQVSEKERSRFFRLMREKVNGRKLALKL
ncbi:MAG: helix-turn-helix transcriptional regulator [Bacteroidota bacterium]